MCVQHRVQCRNTVLRLPRGAGPNIGPNRDLGRLPPACWWCASALHGEWRSWKWSRWAARSASPSSNQMTSDVCWDFQVAKNTFELWSYVYYCHMIAHIYRYKSRFSMSNCFITNIKIYLCVTKTMSPTIPQTSPPRPPLRRPLLQLRQPQLLRGPCQTRPTLSRRGLAHCASSACSVEQSSLSQ